MSHSRQESDFKCISQDVQIVLEILSFVLFACVCACQSSLLSAILGELSQESGIVTVKGELTYTSQQPWILPGTIRSNILFGKELNPKKYDSVLRACALKKVRISSSLVLDFHMPCCIFIPRSLGITKVLGHLACCDPV